MIAMKLMPKDIDINKAIAICTRNDITVSSVKVGRKFAIKVVNDGDETVYDQTVYAHQINSAIKKTWRYYAAKLINEKQDA